MVCGRTITSKATLYIIINCSKPNQDIYAPGKPQLGFQSLYID